MLRSITAAFLGAGALVIMLLAGSHGGASAQTTMTMSSWVSPSHLLTKDVLAVWAQQVEKATDGRVKFQMLPKAPSAPPGTFDAVKDGLVDVSYVTASYTPARHVLPLLPELPGGGATAEINSVAYSRIHWKYLHQVGEYKGVKLLGVFTHGPGQMFNTKRPITKVDDLAGMKIRSGGGISEEMARALGASAFVKPAPESYELLSSGRGRRHVLPARIDLFLQARHRDQVRHAVSRRLLRLRVRLLHERGQVEQAVQGGPGRHHVGLGRGAGAARRQGLGRGRSRVAGGDEEVRHPDPGGLARAGQGRAGARQRTSRTSGCSPPPPRASTAPRCLPSSAKSSSASRPATDGHSPWHRTASRLAPGSIARSERPPPLLLFGLMTLTTADVIGRYIFNWPLRGAFEITELLLLALIFAGLPLASRADEHVTLDFIDTALGPRGRGLLRRLIDLVVRRSSSWGSPGASGSRPARSRATATPPRCCAYRSGRSSISWR